MLSRLGALVVDFYDSVGKSYSCISPWIPTIGTQYEIEVDFDFIYDVQSIYIDGIVQQPFSLDLTRNPSVTPLSLYVGAGHR